MKRKTKIIIFILVIVAILLPIYLLSAVNKKIEERDKSLNNIEKNETQNLTNNKVNNISNTVNNAIEKNTTEKENEIVNNTENNNITNTTNTTTTNNTEETAVSNPEEKAIKVAKEDWGEDDSVYFSYDYIDNDGNYVVSVRTRDTYAKCWYHVNVKDGTFTVTK